MFLFKEPKHIDLKKEAGWVYFKKRVFSILVIFQPFFCNFPLIARFGTCHVTIHYQFDWVVRRTPRVWVPGGNEEVENY